MTTSTEPARARSDEAGKRVPDFFIVGHFKCGTTALYEMLRSHPQIFLPEIKELWFLSPELRSRDRTPGIRPESMAEYLALFADASPEQRAGEVSPSYLMSSVAPGQIAELAPDAKIIALIREPASFLRSFHMQSVQNHIEPETDFGKALALEPLRKEGRRIPPGCSRPHDLMYSEHVRYTEQLRRYYERFAPEQVLVLIYEEFREHNDATMRRVLEFLGVDPTVELRALDANPSVRVRSARFYEAVRSTYLGRGSAARLANALIKAVTTRRMRKAALRAVRLRLVYGKPRDPDHDLMLALRRRFEHEVVAVGEYLGRDLVSFWGYDQLD